MKTEKNQKIFLVRTGSDLNLTPSSCDLIQKMGWVIYLTEFLWELHVIFASCLPQCLEDEDDYSLFLLYTPELICKINVQFL